MKMPEKKREKDFSVIFMQCIYFCSIIDHE